MGFELNKPLSSLEIEEEVDKLRSLKKNDQRVWADTLRTADERSNALKDEIRNLENLKALQEEKLKHFEM